MLNLGILASSYQVAAGLATFATGANFGTVVSNSLAFVNGTAVLDANGTGSRYSTDLYTTTTLGGATIDTPNSSWGANGVVLKTGRDASGTVTIARTSDGGQTWATALNATSTGDRIEAVAYGDVSGTARWIAPLFGDNDAYLSTDNGASFTLQSNVLGGTANSWRSATRMGTAFAVFAHGTASYYTTDIGVTWTLRTLPVVTDSSNYFSSRIFASSSDTTMYLASGSVVYTTSDLVNWTLQGTVPLNGTADIRGAGMAQGNGYWVAAYERFISAGSQSRLEIYYSNNNGTSWSSATAQGNTISQFYDVAFNSSDNGFYVTAGSGNAPQTMRVWRGLS